MLENKLSTMPHNPGCYLMKDKNGTVIYVGKAKDLHKRVNQYFVGVHDNKTTKLVSNIVDFEYIVTPSEKESLILEYNLIKQYKPRFNIMFMDDASYPYIRLTSEKYPVLKLVRDKKKLKNAKYFGPYPNAGYARNLLGLLDKLFPLRKCDRLQPKVCLYYHIGMCLGPCEYEIPEETYREMVDGITEFLKGNTSDMVKKLTAQRDMHSANLEFEKAREDQNLLDSIREITSSQLMQSQNSRSYKNDDIFNYYVDKGVISIVGLLYRDGKLLHRHLYLNSLYDDPEEAFISYIVQYYQSNPLPKTLMIPSQVNAEGLDELLGCSVSTPLKGDKKRLVELAAENARANLTQKWDIMEKENDLNATMARLSDITSSSTSRIELFDNSHISGADAIGAMVVYIDGVASKKDYRTYNVSNGNNDYANMQEVIYRHLLRVVKNEAVKPDMIIVDGGLSQIEAAREIIDSLELDIALFGLVKNDRHQTANLMDRNGEIIDITGDRDVMFLLSNMQDEVHRFAISTFRRKHAKSQTRSVMDELPGIGEKRKRTLIRKFGSFKKIKEAQLRDLQDALGEKTGQNLYNHLHKDDEMTQDN
ncbi:MAG: excinuclease ABC subunit C [Erysipelotrichaceae bacterium]|nr:excinuclease ABC subunit C [Erysipelotrichaceae bacterium]